jgi:hypothetical protein
MAGEGVRGRIYLEPSIVWERDKGEGNTGFWGCRITARGGLVVEKYAAGETVVCGRQGITGWGRWSGDGCGGAISKGGRAR